MPYNRTTPVIKGPAVITWNGHEYYTQDDIKVRMSKEVFAINTSSHGRISRRVIERVVEVTFTPVGEWETAAKTGLFRTTTGNFPFIVGDSWFGTTDLPMVIKPLRGKNLTLHNVNIMKMPSLLFSTQKTMMGAVTFRALQITNAEWSAAASMLTQASGADTTVTDFTLLSKASILTQAAQLSWTGKTGFIPFHHMDGVQVDLDVQLEPFAPDSWGIMDYHFQDCIVTAKCKPIGPTEVEAHTAYHQQDAGAARGMAIDDDAAPLIIQTLAAAEIFTCNGMALTAAEIAYGGKTNRHGEFAWESDRTFATGALVTPFHIA